MSGLLRIISKICTRTAGPLWVGSGARGVTDRLWRYEYGVVCLV